jgi:hypothetical protein
MAERGTSTNFRRKFSCTYAPPIAPITPMAASATSHPQSVSLVGAQIHCARTRTAHTLTSQQSRLLFRSESVHFRCPTVPMGARKQAHIRLCGVLVKRDSLFRRKCSCRSIPPRHSTQELSPKVVIITSHTPQSLLDVGTVGLPIAYALRATMPLTSYFLIAILRAGILYFTRVFWPEAIAARWSCGPHVTPASNRRRRCRAGVGMPTHARALRRCAAYVATTSLLFTSYLFT